MTTAAATRTRTRRVLFPSAPLNVLVTCHGYGETPGPAFSATIRKVAGTSLYEVTSTAADGRTRGTEFRSTDRVWVTTATVQGETCCTGCARDLPAQKYPTTGRIVDGLAERGTECRACRDTRLAAQRAAGGRKAGKGDVRAVALMARLADSGVLLARESA